MEEGIELYLCISVKETDKYLRKGRNLCSAFLYCTWKKHVMGSIGGYLGKLCIICWVGRWLLEVWAWLSHGFDVSTAPLSTKELFMLHLCSLRVISLSY